MFWRITSQSGEHMEESHSDGHFVILQRDGRLDVRLFGVDKCLGWRVPGSSLNTSGTVLETPVSSSCHLDAAQGSLELDSGTFSWLKHDEDQVEVLLHGKQIKRLLLLERDADLTPEWVCKMRDVLESCGHKMESPDTVASLIRDGATAKRRAIERYCGLGRELEGDAFHGDIWRRVLSFMSLEEVHELLHTLEKRFDTQFPTVPISQAEPLETVSGVDRMDEAMHIAREV